MPDDGTCINWTEIKRIARDHNITLREAKEVLSGVMLVKNAKVAPASDGEVK